MMYSRKNLRLSNYDYSANGCYFLTICAHEMKQIFAHIRTVDHTPHTELTDCGRIVEKYIQSLEQRYPIIIEQYAIMPNHLHILVTIDNRAIHESPLRGRSIISQLTGYLKMNVSRDIHQIHTHMNVWQRGFNDRIVRDQQHFLNIWNYIYTNPLRWQDDCYYVEE